MSRLKGSLAEDKAIKFLTSKKFEIIERNFYTKFGEIDIIAKKDGVLHFIEVKSGDSFEPIYNITPSKIKKIIKSVYIYLKNNVNVEFCIDALIISNQEIDLIENITI